MFDLKEQVGDNLYAVGFADGIVVPFRLLTMKEFNSCRTSLFIGQTPAQDIYDYIYRTCVLNRGFIERPDDLRAGIVDSIPKLIYYLSGPHSIEMMEQLLNVERHAANTFESTMRLWICKAFPAYTMQALDQLTFPQLIKLFAEAESLLLQTQQIQEPFSIIEKDQQKRSGFSVEEAIKDVSKLNRI